MKIRLIHKILGGFVIVLALMAVVAAVGIIQLNKAADRSAAMYRENVLGVQFAIETRVHMLASARDEKRAFLAADPAQRSALVAESREAMKKAEDAMAAYHETFASAADEERWAGVEGDGQQGHRRAVPAVMELPLKKDLVRPQPPRPAMTADIAAMNEVLTETAQFNVDLAANSRDAARASADSSRNLLLGISAVAAVAGLGIGIWLARSISGSASHAAAAAISLSKGDLNVSVNASSSDEMGDLGRAFHEMTVYLKEMVGAAAEVASGNLAAEVHPRGSSDALGNALQSMVTNLNELVGTVKTNATSILSASQQLEESSGQMASATGQIASAINRVTTSTVSLNSLAQDSTIEVSRLCQRLRQLAASAPGAARIPPLPARTKRPAWANASPRLPRLPAPSPAAPRRAVGPPSKASRPSPRPSPPWSPSPSPLAAHPSASTSSANSASKSATSSTPSTRSPPRRTSSHSTPPSKPPVPANRAAVSPSSPKASAASLNAQAPALARLQN
ncbi:MAG: MCP four helix bundle domain-containing protein [Dehalococcoidia bacterium]|uniref:MCP four helix bundle domain-containing protein n=1 Tax=Candidatus Amarobacter glycogenicus TaxID=3140699 RepID=UPI003135717E|nr:MCP four helix bundle domain-containing protein [Dehalococcoidia bacterium]